MRMFRPNEMGPRDGSKFTLLHLCYWITDELIGVN